MAFVNVYMEMNQDPEFLNRHGNWARSASDPSEQLDAAREDATSDPDVPTNEPGRVETEQPAPTASPPGDLVAVPANCGQVSVQSMLLVLLCLLRLRFRMD